MKKNWAQKVHLWRKNDKYEVWAPPGTAGQQRAWPQRGSACCPRASGHCSPSGALSVCSGGWCMKVTIRRAIVLGEGDNKSHRQSTTGWHTWKSRGIDYAETVMALKLPFRIAQHVLLCLIMHLSGTYTNSLVYGVIWKSNHIPVASVLCIVQARLEAVTTSFMCVFE